MTEDIDLIRVTGVEYVKDYTMRLDLRNFVQFGLTHWALEWYNGADFAPDYLYRSGVEA